MIFGMTMVFRSREIENKWHCLFKALFDVQIYTGLHATSVVVRTDKGGNSALAGKPRDFLKSTSGARRWEGILSIFVYLPLHHMLT